MFYLHIYIYKYKFTKQSCRSNITFRNDNTAFLLRRTVLTLLKINNVQLCFQFVSKTHGEYPLTLRPFLLHVRRRKRRYYLSFRKLAYWWKNNGELSCKISPTDYREESSLRVNSV